MSRPTIHLTSASLFGDACPRCAATARLAGRDGDTGIYACPAALDLVTGHLDPADADEAHDHYAASEFRRPAVLAAMAKPPPWLVPYTLGRPAWSYAVGGIVPLLWKALGERRTSGDGPAAAAYRAAMDSRWTRCVDEGRFVLGAWAWKAHEGPDGLVPNGATLVCTCRPSQTCHLQWLAPHLDRAGWRVTVYGAAHPPEPT